MISSKNHLTLFLNFEKFTSCHEIQGFRKNFSFIFLAFGFRAGESVLEHLTVFSNRFDKDKDIQN